jgi:hypothetical protein
MNKQTRREKWMETFQGYVVEQLPYPHRIEWDSANHFFNIGLAPDAAAFKYIATRKEATP